LTAAATAAMLLAEVDDMLFLRVMRCVGFREPNETECEWCRECDWRRGKLAEAVETDMDSRC